MTVYDLDKKAAPGPYAVCAPTDLNNRGVDVAFTRCWIDDDEGRKEKTVIHAQIGSGSGDREATAALLAHCRNNYMKALGALKSWVTCEYPADGKPCGVCIVCKLIKELETVL
jgi:hypothetical protein